VEIVHSSHLPRIVARHAPGTHLKVAVLRDKSERTFDLARPSTADSRQA
jgi:hypothetical protein